MFSARTSLRSDMWRERSSKAVLVLAALACLATSKASWRIDVPLPAPIRPNLDQAVQLVVDASRAPTFDCSMNPVPALDEAGRITDNPRATYLCPPGAQATLVTLIGKDGPGGGLCDGPRQPPPGESLVVKASRVVPVWTKAIDISFDGSAGSDVFLNLTTAYPYTIEAIDSHKEPMRMFQWPLRVSIAVPTTRSPRSTRR